MNNLKNFISRCRIRNDHHRVVGGVVGTEGTAHGKWARRLTKARSPEPPGSAGTHGAGSWPPLARHGTSRPDTVPRPLSKAWRDNPTSVFSLKRDLARGRCEIPRLNSGVETETIPSRPLEACPSDLQ